MFPNEEGLLNASAALALVSTFMMSVLCIIALRRRTVGVSFALTLPGSTLAD